MAIRTLLVGLLVIGVQPTILRAQATGPPGSTLAVRVVTDSTVVASATVTIGRASTRSDATGTARFRLVAGTYEVRVKKLGLRPDTAHVRLEAERDTTITMLLVEEAARVAPIMVTSTRVERRLEQAAPCRGARGRRHNRKE